VKDNNRQMKTRKTNGFIIILLVMVIALITVVLVFLSTASNTMMFQANDVYLQACERNLISSGLNWAKTNIQKDNSKNFNNMIELDITEMDILNSSLDIKISSPTQERYQVQIQTSCGRARLNLISDETYIIEP